MVMLMIYLVLLIVSGFLNIPLFLFTDDTRINLASMLWDSTFLDFRADALLVGVISMGISLGNGLKSKYKLRDHKARFEVIQKIAESDALEKVLVDSMAKKMLVLVSLNSRKVYVGMILSTRLENADFDNIALIPVLSGYRDSETLVFKDVHSYISHYKENKITHDSKPLSIYDFRTVIPMDQVEAVSLFDSATFAKFKSKLNADDNNGSTPIPDKSAA